MVKVLLYLYGTCQHPLGGNYFIMGILDHGAGITVTLVTAPSSIVVTVISIYKRHMIQFIIRVSTQPFMPPCSTMPQSKFLR